jgi:hypothetical protein
MGYAFREYDRNEVENQGPEPNMTPNRDFRGGSRNRISASLVCLLTVIALIGVGVDSSPR